MGGRVTTVLADMGFTTTFSLEIAAAGGFSAEWELNRKGGVRP